MKFLLSLFVATFIVACSSAPISHEASIPADHEQQIDQRKRQQGSSITIAAVGDVMLGTDYPQDKLAADDGVQLLAAASPLLRKADIAFANLEGVLQDGGEPRKKCNNPLHCYLFRSPTRYVQHLRNAGFDVLSLANNHARDFGEEGRSSSMQTLAEAGLHHSGRLDDVARWQVKGKKIAMIAFAPFVNANAMLDLELAHKTVSQLARENDIVIVSIHAGAEGEGALNLPFADEMYHGELRGDSVAFAHRVIDAGADMVLGHGPHVPRAIELYRGRLIAYSLGNFCTFWGIKISGNNGVAPLLVTRLDGDGRFLDGQIHSFRQFRPQGSLPDPNKEAAKLMADLTRQDFPHGELQISADGKIERLSNSGN